MMRSYDAIAGVYDVLAGLVFGKALRRAQVHFLSFIPPSATVLLVGGGTGWILEEIGTVHPGGLRIDYVDVSAKMIALARKRNCRQNKVNFIHQSILSFENGNQYDVIITPFLFDNFKEETAAKAFVLLHQKLKEEGLWLYTDFQIKKKSSGWQKALLALMYSFFRVAANIEAARLPDVVSLFSRYRYVLLNNQTFLRRFIITSIYKK